MNKSYWRADLKPKDVRAFRRFGRNVLNKWYSARFEKATESVESKPAVYRSGNLDQELAHTLTFCYDEIDHIELFNGTDIPKEFVIQEIERRKRAEALIERSKKTLWTLAAAGIFAMVSFPAPLQNPIKPDYELIKYESVSPSSPTLGNSSYHMSSVMDDYSGKNLDPATQKIFNQEIDFQKILSEKSEQ